MSDLWRCAINRLTPACPLVMSTRKPNKNGLEKQKKNQSDKIKQNICILGSGSNQLARAPGRLWDFLRFFIDYSTIHNNDN